MISPPIDRVRFWLHDTGTGSPAVYMFTDAQIQEFLDLEKVIDQYGYAPDDTDWTPTYDVLRAAGRGWMWLAGLASNKPTSYRVGDVSVTWDRNYCLQRAGDLMGGASNALQRRDEQTEPDVLARYSEEP
jgi:hypothetical protein